MKQLDLNAYGVQEMTVSEAKEVNGGSLTFIIGMVVGAIIGLFVLAWTDLFD